MRVGRGGRWRANILIEVSEVVKADGFGWIEAGPDVDAKVRFAQQDGRLAGVVCQRDRLNALIHLQHLHQLRRCLVADLVVVEVDGCSD